MLQYITRAKKRRTITQTITQMVKNGAVSKVAKKSLWDGHCHLLLTDVDKYAIK